MRVVAALLIGLALGTPSLAATLEKLTLDQIILSSTAIVRGRVAQAGSFFRGPMIYTRWKVRVAESWKGAEQAEIEVVTPGGAAGGFRQTVSGSPALNEADEYVLFLWTGKTSGLTHVIGLTQGLFTLTRSDKGGATVSRAASTEVLLDAKSRREVADEPLQMSLDELSRRIRQTLAAAKE